MSKLPDFGDIGSQTDEELLSLIRNVSDLYERDKQENQLLYYEPVSEESKKLHTSTAQTVALFGGNGSSKTETSLVEMLVCASGVIPESLKDIWDKHDIDCECGHKFTIEAGENFTCSECKKEYPLIKRKLRGPINCRVVCESLTTVLHPIILPKLQWWKWTGDSEPGGPLGHWGWIPRTSLVQGVWERSWSEKLRILRIKYWDDKRGKYWGESTIQFMSHDNDPSDFASGDFHIVLHDEPPSYAIWTENQARTMRVSGRMMLAMTFPDDPAIAVDWIFDEVYDPGTPGPNKDPEIDWINLYTTDNRFLNQKSVALRSDRWSESVRNVRIFGQPIRFSNRIHPLFTDIIQYWCYHCGKPVMTVENRCSTCHGEVTAYSHVTEEPAGNYPTVFILDPHPRKPHMMIWVQVDAYDDLWQVAELEVEGDCTDVKNACDSVESELGLNVVKRLIDPNMAEQVAGQKRSITWRDEFDAAGLYCDKADNSSVGRMRINEFLKPEETRDQPRIHVHHTCERTIKQFKRYVWDDYRQKLEKGLKQKPKEKEDDFPTMWKYLMNDDPNFRYLTGGAPVITRLKGSKY